jgi:hypothetical protein
VKYRKGLVFQAHFVLSSPHSTSEGFLFDSEICICNLISIYLLQINKLEADHNEEKAKMVAMHAGDTLKLELQLHEVNERVRSVSHSVCFGVYVLQTWLY